MRTLAFFKTKRHKSVLSLQNLVAQNKWGQQARLSATALVEFKRQLEKKKTQTKQTNKQKQKRF